MYFSANKNFKAFAVAGSILVTAFFFPGKLHYVSRISMVHISNVRNMVVAAFGVYRGSQKV